MHLSPEVDEKKDTVKKGISLVPGLFSSRVNVLYPKICNIMVLKLLEI